PAILAAAQNETCDLDVLLDRMQRVHLVPAIELADLAVALPSPPAQQPEDALQVMLYRAVAGQQVNAVVVHGSAPPRCRQGTWPATGPRRSPPATPASRPRGRRRRGR